jgi:hypothetical protein
MKTDCVSSYHKKAYVDVHSDTEWQGMRAVVILLLCNTLLLPNHVKKKNWSCMSNRPYSPWPPQDQCLLFDTTTASAIEIDAPTSWPDMMLFLPFTSHQTLPFRDIMKQRLSRGSGDVVAAAHRLLLERVRALRRRVMSGEVEIQVWRGILTEEA